MRNFLLKSIYIFLLLLPVSVLATHIVGGSLTYVYLGGSSYKITLKLYRDCGPNTAGFPGSVTISVLGNNGQAFSPSKDITMTLGTVTPVPSNLDPCAIPPNPMPCVQEGIYSVTVNNLPPNFGGYHMFYQIVARNLSLTNVNGACNCIGESFYAYIPGIGGTPIWNEDFTLNNNTTQDNGTTSWNITNGVQAPSFAAVNNNMFQVTGANNSNANWNSQTINLASCSGSVNLSVNLSESGNLDLNDSIYVFYRINGGPLIPFSVNGIITDDFNNAVATSSIVGGGNVQIIVRFKFDGNSPNTETYRIDNVNVTCINQPFIPNSNAVFDFFPPLFICVNQPFSFDHSATDADGDSLVYSLYNPYDGDGGVGALDPTFPSNTASFTPVTFLPGYSTNNPLGPGPFNLNPNTGLLTGVPSTIGQFVVGVMVKEYRNGVYISQTLRDFQFNVLNCPQPPPTLAVPNSTINNGCASKPTATGITSVSATWTSIFPGTPGQYNNYLACTSGCLNNTVSPVGTPPPFIDFLVCGNSTSCSGNMICDTFRVTFNPTLYVNIFPSNPTLCFGQTSTTLSAIGSGGTPPYTYLWNNVNTTQSINVGIGTYNIQLSDASGCPPVYNSVSVTAFSTAISANAGPDQIKCTQSPMATINASVSGASGGIWSGGTGTFSPNNTTLVNLNYTPSAAELANGFVKLVLTTTGNGSCPSQSDTLKITYSGFTGTIVPTATNVSCYGGNNGIASVSVTAGYSPFTYTWTTVPTLTSSTISNLNIGSYSVTIRDGIGCTTQTLVNITQPSPLNFTSSKGNLKCFGINTGSISVNSSGGTAPYTYSWSPGNQITNSITNQAAGNYTVRITDSKGCVTTGTFTLTQPNAINVTLTGTNVSCNAGTNGVIISSVSGGTAPYTYSWNPIGATTTSITGLSAGIYSLVVLDNNSCTSSKTINISQPTVLNSTFNITNETCDYLNNGTATITATGGTGPYSFSTNPGSITTSTINNLTSGTYTTSITDSKGCVKVSTFSITEPTPLQINFSNINNVACFNGNNGSVAASPSGGTPAYTYTWLPSGVNTASISNLTIGIYTVNIKDSKQCILSNTVQINQPSDINISLNTSSTKCFSTPTGSITSSVSGGTPNYSYLWLPNGSINNSLTNIATGTYTLNITDNNGCLKTATATVQDAQQIIPSISFTNASCSYLNNGSASVSSSGGSTPYSYTWTPGNSTNTLVTSLAAGTYTVKVKDLNNCIVTQTVAISKPSALSTSITTTNETCNYLNNGTAAVSVSGGTSPYNYSWNSGLYTTPSVSNLSSGIYTLVVTDNASCVLTKTISITQPSSITINFNNQINVSCFGGTNGYVSTSTNGGSPGYTYSWAPNGSTSNSSNNLSAGIYTVTVTDTKSCIATNTVNISQPSAPITNSISITPITCYGLANASATANVSGGTPTYNYTWTPGNTIGQTKSNMGPGTYTVNVKDSKGCILKSTVIISQPSQMNIVSSSTNATCGNSNGEAEVTVSGGTGPYSYSWSPSGSTNSITTNVNAGTYTVLVTDANGCLKYTSVNINDTGGPIASIFSTTNVSCFGGSDGGATASMVGGTPPFTISWSPSGGNNLVATGLSAGTYNVTIIDSNGCSTSATTSPEITEPPRMDANVQVSDVSCFSGTNGTATVSAYGGTPSYNYTWQPTANTGSVTSNLSAGTYSVIIKDDANCIQTKTFTIAQPTLALGVTPSSSSVSCFGGSDGSLSSSVIGGTAPYDFEWLPGNLSGTSQSGLPSGNYTIYVTDHNNCSSSNTISITQPSIITLNSGSQNSNCSNANGQATITASGGVGAYSYTWEPVGGNNSIASSLTQGIYTITVTDGNGCIAVTNHTINDNPAPTVSISLTSSISCFGGSNGALDAIVNGGSGPFTYTWIPSGGNNSTASGLSNTSYSIIVTSANGCTVEANTSFIPEPTQIWSSITTTNVNCFAGNDGKASAIAGGGIPPYTFNWLPAAVTGSIVNGLSAGTQTLTVNDLNNCSYTNTFSIQQPTAALTVNSSYTAVSCFSGNDGIATATANGGTMPYSYTWPQFNFNGQTITNLSNGTYSVNVIDQNGCSSSGTVMVTQPTQSLTINIANNPTSCFGGSNGSATVTANGGTPSYSYSWSPTGGNSSIATNLSPGQYFVTVEDDNHCTSITSFSVSQPSQISGTLTTIDAACNKANGSITSLISGGTGPYTYTWTPGNINTNNISAIFAGNYTVIINDNNGCAASYTSTVNNLSGPSISISSNTNVSCFGGNDGATEVNAISGNPPYTFNWLPFGGNTSSANQLTAGTYSAIVTDSKTCEDTVVVNISEPNLLTVTSNSIGIVSCYGGNNGSISLITSGGNPTYAYTWFPIGNGNSSNNLSAGNYTILVSDTKNCSTGLVVNVGQPDSLISSIGNVTNPLCYNSTGSAFVNVSGGVPPYNYNWSTSPIQTSNSVSNITAGTYSVTVTDSYSCSVTNTVLLTQPNPVVTLAGLNDTICLGSSGLITASANGGVGNYYYVWQPTSANTQGSLTVSPLTSTDYTVVAFDQNGCAGNPDYVSTIVYSLNQNNLLSANDVSICPGQSALIYTQVTGNIGNVSYNWNNNLGNTPGPFVVIPTQPTKYVVDVTSSCGITVSDTINVSFNPPPTLNAITTNTFICAPGMINFADLSTSSNASDPITSWLWNFGDGETSNVQNPNHYYELPGTYAVNLTVTTDGGCKSNNISSPIVINAQPTPVASFSINSSSLNLPYDQLICTNLSVNANQYEWSFGDGGTSSAVSPEYNYTSIGNYQIQLIAITPYGCRDTAKTDIITDADIVFPNAFTPNENGSNGGYYSFNDYSNDIFFPYSSGVIEYKLEIFNRWGELIFETTDVKQGWDGYYRNKICQVGVYIWKAYAKFNNGKEFSKTGDVTLLK